MPVYADDEEDDDDDDEIIAIQDPKKAMHEEANRRAKNLGRRAIPVLILGLAALYLTMAEGLGCQCRKSYLMPKIRVCSC